METEQSTIREGIDDPFFYTKRYALAGALFGVLFPLGSTMIQAHAALGSVSVANMVAVQNTVLMWVIDSAPLFLGLFASFAGRRQDALNKILNQLEHSNRALETANSELIRASKLKSQFLANMSHELRTPLNAIIGFSRILIRKTESLLPDRQAKNLRMVHESGQHLLEMVNDILDIERIEAGMLRTSASEVNVEEMAHDVISKARPLAAEKQITLSATVVKGPIHLLTDPIRLRQILDNLVVNAIKYSDVGHVELKVYRDPPESPTSVRCEITDQGLGIPTEQIATIFDPFHQVDGSSTRAQGGVGLGLHLVKRLAELLGGDVVVESEIEKGSTFTLVLPASKLIELGPPLSEASKSIAPEGEGPLVLVIDDQQRAIEIMHSELVDAGYRVHTALGGKEGLSKAQALKPDIILLDIIMPDMDGWAVLKALRSSPDLSTTPVVITSMLNDVPLAFELGIVAWLTKPVSPDAFKKVFDNIGIRQKDDILVVEDDAPTRSLILQHLIELGVAARAVADGRSAVEAFEDRVPKAIILDLMLPHMDGFQVLEYIREREKGRNVPVVVYSAKDLTEEEKDRLTGGMVNVINKGSEDSIGTLLSGVARALKRRSENPEVAAR